MYIYMYIYILFLCMQKEIIGQIMILRKSKTFAIGWVRGCSFQLPETTRKKIYQSHETLGSYSNSARPDSCMKGCRVQGILRHTLQVPTLLFFFPLQSWLGFCWSFWSFQTIKFITNEMDSLEADSASLVHQLIIDHHRSLVIGILQVLLKSSPNFIRKIARSSTKCEKKVIWIWFNVVQYLLKECLKNPPCFPFTKKTCYSHIL